MLRVVVMASPLGVVVLMQGQVWVWPSQVHDV
jgi:hypothetical protein